MISITLIALFCLSLSTKTECIESPHNRHLSHGWQPLGHFAVLHLQGIKCSWQRRAQRTHSPDGNELGFCLVTGCSSTCYLQGVQPVRFLAHLCLLAVQGGQELPSHPEMKAEVIRFVHCWENVPKCKKVLQKNIILLHPDLILPAKEWDQVVSGQKYRTVSVTSCQEKCLPHWEGHQPTSVSTHTTSARTTSHNWAGMQLLQVF